MCCMHRAISAGPSCQCTARTSRTGLHAITGRCIPPMTPLQSQFVSSLNAWIACYVAGMERRRLTPLERNRVAADQSWMCAGNCGKPLPAEFDIDHMVPLHLGGVDETHNMQALCPLCHAVKTRSEASERAKQKAKNKEAAMVYGAVPRGHCLCGDCGEYFSKYFIHYHSCKAEKVKR